MSPKVLFFLHLLTEIFSEMNYNVITFVAFYFHLTLDVELYYTLLIAHSVQTPYENTISIIIVKWCFQNTISTGMTLCVPYTRCVTITTHIYMCVCVYAGI